MRLSFDIKIQIFISKFKVRSWGIQKQPPRDVLKKRYSENMQQIYSRIPMPKCIHVKSHFVMGVLL